MIIMLKNRRLMKFLFLSCAPMFISNSVKTFTSIFSYHSGNIHI